jgi:murein DD-endopeptidase MepM/ murein hydrolase activator NlpD
MLRALLGVLLLAVVGSIGFYLGRSSAPAAHSTAIISIPTAEARATADGTRSRTKQPELPAPPEIAPKTDLTKPSLPNTVEGQVQGDSAPLFDRALGSPIVGLSPSSIQDTFDQARDKGERKHEATDILAPRGTPVVAVDTGVVAKLFTSKAGGLTVYQFDPSQNYAYYYAHLDRYAEGLTEGKVLKKGDVLGYVGTTGNADPNTPHLHFAIFELGPEKRWWEGRPINPYPLLLKAVGR